MLDELALLFDGLERGISSLGYAEPRSFPRIPVAKAALATKAAAGVLRDLRASAAARPSSPSFSRLSLTPESRSPGKAGCSSTLTSQETAPCTFRTSLQA